MSEALKTATAADLLAMSKRRFMYVPIPDSDVRVRIRSLTEKERSAYELSTRVTTGKKFDAAMETTRRRLIALVCVDDNGNPLFKPTDTSFIEDMDNAATSAIFDAAWVFCGFARQQVEAEVKNSDGGPDSGPPGGQPSSVASETSTPSSTG